MDNLANAFDVGEDVVMRQHDAFGGSRAAAREYDCRQSLWLLILAIVVFQESARYEKSKEQRQQSVKRRESFPDLLQESHPRYFTNVCFCQKQPGSNDSVDSALTGRGIHRLRTYGKVQVDRDLSGQEHGNISQRPTNGGRK